MDPRKRIRFTPEINLGTLLSLIALLITLVSLASDWNRRFASLEVKVDALWTAYTKGGR